MKCDDKKTAFDEGLKKSQAAFKLELDALTAEIEAKAKKISDDFEADNDLAGGVGAVSGAAFGGVVGGPVGAAVGATVGKTIGKLFTLELGFRTEKVVLNVPQTKMDTQDFSFDVPTVAVRDTDISFDLPVIVMRRQRGPDIPQVTMVNEDHGFDLPFGGGHVSVWVPVPYITMVESYLDVPTTEMQPQHIIVGVPKIEMVPQTIKIDVPTVTMVPTEFSTEIPYVTIRFIKDAGKRTAALAAALAQEAQSTAQQKQAAYRSRLRADVAPLAIAMFSCFKENMREGRSDAALRFAPEIDKLTNALVVLKSKGLPPENSDLKAADELLADAVRRRDAALKQFDDSIAKLEASEAESLKQFLGQEIAPASTI